VGDDRRRALLKEEDEMKRPRGFRPAILAVALTCLVAAPAAGAQSSPAPPDPGDVNPMIFVHGSIGSGAQFQSQQMRFASNGYPRSHIRVVEYNSLAIGSILDQVHDEIDQTVAELQARTGSDQVDLIGHSLGTFVSQEYLASPERAANIGHYVNVDGRQADAPPGDVRTLAIWAGRGAPDRSVEGATNVTIPNQTHVEVNTSAEAFAEMFKFFTGSAPHTSDIVPQRPRRLTISGRAVLFPQNVGVDDATLRIWRIDPETGRRQGPDPVDETSLAADGSWTTHRIVGGQHYELQLVREGTPVTIHYYFEPFRRSDHLVRLLTSNPGEGTDALIEKSEGHARLVVLRYKELWGDQGDESDILRIAGQNVLNPQTSPISNQTNGMIVYDVGSDGVSDLSAPIPEFAALPFQSGVDLFMPAARPPDDTVPVALRSRGSGPARSVSFPNRPSTTSQHIVVFNDFDTRLIPARLGFAELRPGRPRALHPKRAERPRQRTVRFRIRVRNRGASWAERARVCLLRRGTAAQRSLHIPGRPCRSLGPLAPGATQDARLRARVTQRASRGPVRVRARVSAANTRSVAVTRKWVRVR
jgi:pimeloyl-ACP methyl ester carboxylesterase